VSADEDGVIVDACTLKNFTVVRRLDILETHLGQRARWTQAIQREAARLQVPAIDWLGTAISVGDDITVLLEVDKIRRGLGATRADSATLHLGEAEAIYYLETQRPAWTFVSDDRPAVDFAIRRGLNAIDTPAVLAACYTRDQIGCPGAFELIRQMAQAERGVRVPPSHWFVCPPKSTRPRKTQRH
jgi:predicted nucleic acid-binding protein